MITLRISLYLEHSRLFITQLNFHRHQAGIQKIINADVVLPSLGIEHQVFNIKG